MKPIVEIKYGSHLYGTDTPNSDLDLKGVFLPTREQWCDGSYQGTIQTKRNKAVGEKNTKDDVDREMISLPRFVELLCEGQTMALDMLFAPVESFTPEGRAFWEGDYGWVWSSLYHERERFVSRDVTAFVGYARKQAAKYGVKGSRLSAVRATLDLLKQLHPMSKLSEHEGAIRDLIEQTKEHVSMEKSPLVEILYMTAHKDGPMVPYLHVCGRKCPFSNQVRNAIAIYQRVFDQYGARALQAETNKGVDWKALSHAVRVQCEAMELLMTGKITLPCPNRELILAIKKGELPYKDVALMIECGLKDLLHAQSVSKLRSKPDQEYADQWLKNVMREVKWASTTTRLRALSRRWTVGTRNW